MPVKKILSLLWCCLIAVLSWAQSETDTFVKQKDTTPAQDTVKKTVVLPVPGDSVQKPVKKKPKPAEADSTAVKRVDSVPHRDSVTTPVVQQPTIPEAEEGDTLHPVSIAAFQQVLRNHPYYNFFGTPLNSTMLVKKVVDKDALFYYLLGLLFYMGIIHLLFDKYLSNVVTLFFRASLRQQQIREQLLQSPLPSLLLNILFLLTGGLFLTFTAIQYKIAPNHLDFWLIYAYSIALLLVVYLGKFVMLKVIGWIFNVSHATDTYIFIVFLVNKIIGIFLLPVVVLLAFPFPDLYQVVFTLSFVLIVVLYIYRFIISYKPIRNEIKVSKLHFFVYLCAFEIAPLLLIYKVLLIFVERSY